MTKTQLRKKFRELKRNNNELMDELFEKALRSGAFEIKRYEDDFVLPRIIMSAICKQLHSQWEPLTPEWRKEAKNLSHFI